MTANPRRTFHYHANAHVLSGQFTRPVQHLIEVQGPTSLPTTGGHGQSLAENVGLDHFVSVKRGYTHVSGSPQEIDGKIHYTTLVTGVAEGVNILDVVTADRLVARLASNATDDGEPHFSLLGTKFENLQIAGCPTAIEINTKLFEDLPTFKEATDAYAIKKSKNHAEFRRISEDPFETGQKLSEQPQHGAILCSIVDTAKLKPTCPGVTPQAHCLTIPKFGKLFLGEILLRHGRRTLTMIRFELGSPVAGSGVVVQLDSNGQQWPPTRG